MSITVLQNTGEFFFSISKVNHEYIKPSDEETGTAEAAVEQLRSTRPIQRVGGIISQHHNKPTSSKNLGHLATLPSPCLVSVVQRQLSHNGRP